MKIGEARKTYSVQVREFWEEKKALENQKKTLEDKIKATPNGKETFAKEAVTLELSYHAVSEKYEEYSKTMNQIMDQYTALFNAEVSKQQGEAMEEYAEDMVKLMEVARRIMKGARVPASDEKKLMEYSMELYMAAKNMAVLNENKKKEEYDSLWEDEEKEENPDPDEIANDAEFAGAAPEVVEVSDVVASAAEGAES